MGMGEDTHKDREVAPDIEQGSSHGAGPIDGRAGRPADPEERGRDAEAADHGRDQSVLDIRKGITGVRRSPAPGVGEPLDEHGRDGREKRSRDSGEEGKTDLLDVELVHCVQDDGNEDEGGENEGKVEPEIEADEHDDGLRYEHLQRIEEGVAGHLRDGNAAGGGHESVGDPETPSSLPDDLSRVGFRNADAEEVGRKDQHQSHPLRPSPSSIGEDEAADDGSYQFRRG